MLYDSLDIIPLKIYMRVANEGNLTLLTDEQDKYKVDVLQPLWDKLRDEYNGLGISNGAKKIIDVNFRIEALKTKYDFVNAACNALNFERDEELENTLREFGYTLRAVNEFYQKDLDHIKREANNILIQAKRLGKDIKKERPGDEAKHTIDTVIIGYMAATGISYDTNKITVMQFDGLKNTFESKLKAMQKPSKKNAPKPQKFKK